MQQESEECIVQITEESRPLSSRKQRAGTAFGGFFHSAGNGIVRLCRFLAWLLWNFALALCALPFLGAGLAALLLFGVLMVWLASASRHVCQPSAASNNASTTSSNRFMLLPVEPSDYG